MKKVIIIGGGFCGAYCAKKLEKDFDVTLIDNKPYFEFTPSILRTILEPEHQEAIQAMHNDYLKRSKVIYDDVIDICGNEVRTKKKKYLFDYLVIAAGSSYSSPIKASNVIPVNRARELEKYHDKLYKAKRILIAGGGIVGTELTAEIATHCGERKITLIHAHNQLMERNHPKARKYAENFLRKKGVEIIFNERVLHNGKSKKEFITDKKRKIKADVVLFCTGINPNSKFLKKCMPELINNKGHIEVNEYLQVNDHKNVFAGGDITAIKEEKTAQTAERHAQLIVKNIRNLADKKKLKKYRSRRRIMVISLGKFNGIIDNGKIVFGGIIPAFLKKAIEIKTMIRYR